MSSLLNHRNQPFAPADRRSAQDLIAADSDYRSPHGRDVAPGLSSIRSTLVKGWKDVETLTRKQ